MPQLEQLVNCIPNQGYPEVSIVMSCFNAKRWLDKAINSVLAQTFQNFEFILVDDGSNDETWDIIKNYRLKDQRIVAISKSNSGLADSLNAGISQARGVWVARLDADDLSEPDRLEKQLAYVHAHPDVLLLGTGFVEVDEYGSIIKKHQYPSEHDVLVWHMEHLQRFFPHSSAFFRRDIVKEVGGYNPLFKKSQDWDLWLRISERGKIACLPECLVSVRRHADQVSSSMQGVSQYVYGISAVVCHFLRREKIYLALKDEKEWMIFLDWVGKQVALDGYPERRRAWAIAREGYFAVNGGMTGLLRFLLSLLHSGYLWDLTQEKIFGLHLPKKLASQWVELEGRLIATKNKVSSV